MNPPFNSETVALYTIRFKDGRFATQNDLDREVHSSLLANEGVIYCGFLDTAKRYCKDITEKWEQAGLGKPELIINCCSQKSVITESPYEG